MQQARKPAALAQMGQPQVGQPMPGISATGMIPDIEPHQGIGRA